MKYLLTLICCLGLCQWPAAQGTLYISVGGDYEPVQVPQLDAVTELAVDYNLFYPLSRETSLIGSAFAGMDYKPVAGTWSYTYLAEIEFSRVSHQFVFKPGLMSSGDLLNEEIFGWPEYYEHALSLGIICNLPAVSLSLLPSLNWDGHDMTLQGRFDALLPLSEKTTINLGLDVSQTLFVYENNAFNLEPAVQINIYDFYNFDIETSLACAWNKSDYSYRLVEEQAPVLLYNFFDASAEVYLTTARGGLIYGLKLPVILRLMAYNAVDDDVFLDEREWRLRLQPELHLYYYWLEDMEWEFLLELDKDFSNSPAREQLALAAAIYYKIYF